MTTRIKALRNTRGDGKSLTTGECYDVEDDTAKQLIAIKKAELAPAKPKKAEVAKTEKPAGSNGSGQGAGAGNEDKQ